MGVYVVLDGVPSVSAPATRLSIAVHSIEVAAASLTLDRHSNSRSKS